MAKIWKLLAGIILLGAVIALRQLASLPDRGDLALIAWRDRSPFPVDFTLPDLHGDKISFSEQQGKVILLNFWATWCRPCRVEMPSINEVFKNYRGKSFLVLAVASDTQGKDVVAPFVQQYDLAFPILLDPQDIVGRRLQLPGIPATYVIDRQGRIALAAFGLKDWNTPSIHRLLKALMAESDHDPS